MSLHVLSTDGSDLRLFGISIHDVPRDSQEWNLKNSFLLSLLSNHRGMIGEQALLVVKISHLLALKLVRCGFLPVSAFENATVLDETIRLDIEAPLQLIQDDGITEGKLRFTLLVQKNSDALGLDCYCCILPEDEPYDRRQELDDFVQRVLESGMFFPDETNSVND